jgi:hypothetical protein
MPVTETDLREWIAHARATYEVSPHVEMNGTVARRVGLDVTLRANRSDECTGDPTCEACDQTIERLQAIACEAVPPGADHEIAPDDHAFHLRPETGFAPELELTVAVFYGPSAFDEAGAESATLSHRMTKALEGMGVQPRVFRG